MIDYNNSRRTSFVELSVDEMRAVEGGGFVSFLGEVLVDKRRVLSTGESGDGSGGRGIAGGNV